MSGMLLEQCKEGNTRVIMREMVRLEQRDGDDVIAADVMILLPRQ